MRCTCPNCAEVLIQNRSVRGLNYCTTCHQFFLVAPESVPTWILGVLTVLVANWQMLCRLHAG